MGAKRAARICAVMPGHGRSKNGVASPMVPGIHAFVRRQDVDGRDKPDKPGHDEREI